MLAHWCVCLLCCVISEGEKSVFLSLHHRMASGCHTHYLLLSLSCCVRNTWSEHRLYSRIPPKHSQYYVPCFVLAILSIIFSSYVLLWIPSYLQPSASTPPPSLLLPAPIRLTWFRPSLAVDHVLPDQCPVCPASDHRLPYHYKLLCLYCDCLLEFDPALYSVNKLTSSAICESALGF